MTVTMTMTIDIDAHFPDTIDAGPGAALRCPSPARSSPKGFP
jgi:hypothetical protein